MDKIRQNWTDLIRNCPFLSNFKMNGARSSAENFRISSGKALFFRIPRLPAQNGAVRARRMAAAKKMSTHTKNVLKSSSFSCIVKDDIRRLIYLRLAAADGRGLLQRKGEWDDWKSCFAWSTSANGSAISMPIMTSIFPWRRARCIPCSAKTARANRRL